MMKRGQRGIEIREAHFPGRAQIEAYGNGGFRFAGMSHVGSLISLPSGIYGWNVKTIDDLLSPAAYETLFSETDTIEVFLLGTGMDIVPVKPDIRAMFRERNIMINSMGTGAAVRTFNVMLAESRAVAAGFLAV